MSGHVRVSNGEFNIGPPLAPSSPFGHQFRKLSGATGGEKFWAHAAAWRVSNMMRVYKHKRLRNYYPSFKTTVSRFISEQRGRFKNNE